MAKTKKEYNEYMRKYQLARYYRIREEIIVSLGGKCANCPEEKNLEIDHINPEEKEFDVCAGIRNKSRAVLNEELKKCQLLCENCHLKKTKEYYRNKMVHGTEWMFRKYKCRCGVCVTGASLKRKSYPSRRKKIAL